VIPQAKRFNINQEDSKLRLFGGNEISIELQNDQSFTIPSDIMAAQAPQTQNPHLGTFGVG
jgi:hypothetical protein